MARKKMLLEFMKEMLQEFVKVLRSVLISPKTNTVPQDGTRHVLATEEMEYKECSNFLPLLDGDVVYCPSCYDGDTARVCFVDRVGNSVRILVRIAGINTPEVRTSSQKEKALALTAKNRLEDAVAGKFVTIRNPKTEKYGRCLSDLEVGDIKSVTDYMLADPEICVPYNGGKKVSWE